MGNTVGLMVQYILEIRRIYEKWNRFERTKFSRFTKFSNLENCENFSIWLHKWDIYGHSGEVGDIIQDTKFYTEIKHSYDTGNISLKTPEMAKLPQKVKSRYFQILNLIKISRSNNFLKFEIKVRTSIVLGEKIENYKSDTKSISLRCIETKFLAKNTDISD